MNDRPFDQTQPAYGGGFGGGPGAGGPPGNLGGGLGGGGLSSGGPAGEWLREAAPGWAAPAAPWPRYDLAEPPRPRLNVGGAAPWLAAGLLCAFLIVNRSPAPAPVAAPTPVAAGLPSPVAACGPVAP